VDRALRASVLVSLCLGRHIAAQAVHDVQMDILPQQAGGEMFSDIAAASFPLPTPLPIVEV
jgi:hypothetical protein